MTRPTAPVAPTTATRVMRSLPGTQPARGFPSGKTSKVNFPLGNSPRALLELDRVLAQLKGGVQRADRAGHGILPDDT
jgi:hypothetical protein